MAKIDRDYVYAFCREHYIEDYEGFLELAEEYDKNLYHWAQSQKRPKQGTIARQTVLEAKNDQEREDAYDILAMVGVPFDPFGEPLGIG